MIWLICLFGLILRLISLNQSLWLDEAIEAWAVSNFSYKDLITSYSISDFHPPLYHLLLKAWTQIFGISEISLRLPSVLLGALTIYVVYLLGKEIKNQKFAIITSLLLTTSSLHIYYSQEARMYSLNTFLAALSSFFLLKLSYNSHLNFRKSFLLWVGFTLTTILFLYTTYLSFFMLFGFLAFLVWEKKRIKGNFWRKFGLNIGIVCLTFLVWIPYFIKQLSVGQKLVTAFPVWSATVGGASLKSFLLVFIKFSIGRISLENKLMYGLLMIPILILASFLIVRSFQDKKSRFFVSCFFIPLFLSFLFSFFVPAVSYFRLLYLLPFFYFLISFGLTTFNQRLRKTLLSLILLLNLITSSIYLFNPKFHREDWRSASQYLKKVNSENSPVLIIKEVERPFLYYDLGESKVLPFGQAGNELTNYDTIWVVPYAEAIFDPSQAQRRMIEGLGFKNVFTKYFNGVGIEKFTKE